MARPLSIHAVGAYAALLLTSFAGTARAAGKASEARTILDQSGIKGGFVVHVGCGDAELTTALHASESYQVQGLDRDATAIQKARESISAKGVYGPVAVEHWDGGSLPYIENLVNLLVIEDASEVPADEIERVLTPNGVAMVRDGSGWKRTVKPRPAEMGDWTHYYHDSRGNAVSPDKFVAPPSRMQWLGNPRWSRHHDRMSSLSGMVSCAGRLYYILDEGSRISILLPPKWTLIARDAFNGVILWKKPIGKWNTYLWPLKSGPTQLTRRLVAEGENTYVTMAIDAPISCFNGATGELVREYPETRGAEEFIMRDGVIYALVNPNAWQLTEFAPAQQSDQKRVETEYNWDRQPRTLIAVEAASGKVLWKKEQQTVAPITLATEGSRLLYHDGQKIIALNAGTGQQEWATEPAATRKLFEFNYSPRLVLHDDVALYAGGDGEMKGYDVKTGKELWKAPHEKSGYRSPEDLMVAGGLVWNAGTTSGNQDGEFKGRDIHTGEVKKSFLPDVPAGTYWFHHRCYIAKATDNFLMTSRTGIEYVDIENQHWDLNHWVRGACLYGVLPANGLTYAGPHNCACYPEAKLFGINAMAPAARYPLPKNLPEEKRLLKGPAYDQPIEESDASDNDWPTYRHDNARSGYTAQSLKKDLNLAWEVKLAGRLSPMTIANGKVFISQIDAHTVHALSAKDGTTAWKFIAGARVDSPPSFWKGRVFFGCADGCVYALRATDGALIWRFHAAPAEMRHFAFEQLESVWPVPGSVLVENDLVSFVSGRSCFLDGGLRFFRLDARTGTKKVEVNYDDRDPETGNDLQTRHKTLQMPVALNDVLSSDGKYTYLRSQKILPDGERFEIGPVSGDAAEQGGAQTGEGAHIFAPMGFLDDSWFHRSYWVYGRNFAGGHNGYYQAGKYAPFGRILVFDDKNVYSYGREAKYLKWTTTMEHSVFATSKEAPKVEVEPAGGGGPAKKGKAGAKGKKGATSEASTQAPGLPGSISYPNADVLDPTNKGLTIEAWLLPDEGNGLVAQYGGPLNGFALELRDRKPVFHLRSNKTLTTVSSRSPLGEGWHHVAATLDTDKKSRIYLDGEVVAEGDASGLLSAKPKNTLMLGNASGGVADEKAGAYTGLMDQLAYYTRALTQEEVLQRFNEPDSKPRDAALASSFDNGDARDDSSGGNHGVSTGVETGKGRVGAALWFRKGTYAAKGGGSFVQRTWDRYVPIVTRSMALAGRSLIVAGPPDTLDEEYAFERLANKDQNVQAELAEQNESLDGKRGAKLWTMDIKSGEQSGGFELDSPPVWDGMCVAQGSLFVATVDGRVKCFGK